MMQVLKRSKSSIQDIIENYKELPNQTTAMKLLVQNMWWALLYPNNGEFLSTYGELSSYRSLLKIRSKMQNDIIGKQILEQKPRIRSWYFDYESLGNLPNNTLGYQYWHYMKTNDFDINKRPIVKHIPDIELAYIFQWYKEVHDFLHVILNKSSSVLHELEIKLFEFYQIGLSSCATASIFGSVLVPMSEKVELFTVSGPEMIRIAKNSKMFLNVNYLNHLEQDIDEFRKDFFNSKGD